MNPLRDLKEAYDGGADEVIDDLAGLPASLPAATQQSLQMSRRRFMDEHTTCAMCDTKLEIRHEINMNDLKVKEEAHCPSCGIRVRSSHHLMH